MLKSFRAVTALWISLSLCTVSMPAFCAEPDAASQVHEAITAEQIVSESVINYFNMNRLLYKGVLSDIDLTLNESMTVNDNLYAEMSWLEKYLDISYTWDGSISSAVITDGKEKCGIVCDSVETLDTDGKKGFFLGEYTYIPLKELCGKMGWSCYLGDDFWAVSKTLTLEEIIDKNMSAALLDEGKTVVGEYDFEDEEKLQLSKGLWNGALADAFSMPCEIVTEGDNSFMQIGAAQMGYGGLYLPPIQYEKSSVIDISFDAMASDDFAGASFTFLIQAFKNGVFQKYIDGIYSTPEAGKWTRFTKKLDTSSLPADATDIRLVFCTTNKPERGEPAGRLMFDNVKLISYPVIKDTSETIRMKADKLGNWYILGETITMTPTNKLDENEYKKVTVEIYDSWNNLVSTETVSASSFNSGYKWKPEKQGFYEFQFYTIDNKGQTEELNDFQKMTNPNTKEEVKIYLKRQGVVVARYETKPMEERSDRLAVSVEAGRYLNPEIANGRTKGLQGDQIAIADLLGFKKIRLHWISPDGLNYKTQSKANVKRGDFDFTEWDLSVNEARGLGFDLVLNMLGTPRYAVPYRDGWTTPTGANNNYYAPVDMAAWRAFIEYAVNRYKDDCHIWEIWNEPHVYGGSVFWKGITEDYAEMHKTAYETIKKYQPGDESIVTIGGIGARRYVNFYEEFVKTDAYDYFDALPMHGWDVDPWNYNKIAEDYGKEAKPICSTELHMMLRTSDSEYLNNTEKEEAIRMIVEFLKDFKYGSIFTTFFAINVQHNVEWLKYLNENKIYGQGMDGGAYKVGISQPRFAAIAMNTFFDTVGKQYDYVDEYLLANKKQNVVRVKNNGKDQLIVWNVGGSKSNTTILSKQITDCAAEDFKIIDWENVDVDTSDLNGIEIKPETMYFISGLDSEKLDLIESAQGDELYTGDVLYNITEKQKSDTTRNLTHVITNGDTKPLFNKDTFALSDNITYTDNNWKWVSKDKSDRGDFDAKYALSIADDGMYIVAKVNDATDNALSEAPDKMNQNDSIQFAFDTVGDRSANGYMECYAGLDSDGKAIVYKKTAPYIGGDMIADFTPGDTVISKAAAHREVNGSEITYMIYLPNSEIYPLERNTYEAMHFSILVNQNDGTGCVGFLEWGSGLGNEKNPQKFGDVWLDSSAAEENNVYYPTLAVASNDEIFDRDTLEYSQNINWITDGFKYVPLNDDDRGSFNAKLAFGVTEDGLYIAAEVDDENINMEAKGKGGTWSMDSMQLGIDVGMRGSADDRIECQFGRIVGGESVLYKEAAPFITAEKAPEGYTQSKTCIEDCVKDITVSDGKIIYKVFIPSAEFYPFNTADNDIMKISVLFNQNDGTSRVGYLEWNSGIGGNKNPGEYGIVSYR